MQKIYVIQFPVILVEILFARFELNSIKYLFKLTSRTNYSHLYFLVSLSSFFYPKKGNPFFPEKACLISQNSFNF